MRPIILGCFFPTITMEKVHFISGRPWSKGMIFQNFRSIFIGPMKGELFL